MLHKSYLPATTVSLLVAVAGYASAQTAPVAAATVTAAPATKAPAAAVGPVDDAAAVAKLAHELGLTVRQRSGVTVYCRSTAEIGTRLPTMTCYHKEQLPALATRSQQNQESIAAAQRSSLTEPNKH